MTMNQLDIFGNPIHRDDEGFKEGLTKIENGEIQFYSRFFNKVEADNFLNYLKLNATLCTLCLLGVL